MKVAISGGGIAGLCVAGVLAERGHAVHVFERFDRETMGAGIVCFPNATRVLRHWGLEDRVREVAGRPWTMRRMSKEAEPLGDLSIALIDETVGAPSYSILRRDLHRLLFDFARERGAVVERGCEVTRVVEDGQLELKDGRRIDADWVIGADGRMASPLRSYVVGYNRPKYGGFVNWVGVACSAVDVFDPHVVLDVWGVGERFGLVPIDNRTAYFAGGAVTPLAQANREDLLPMLLQRFDGWPTQVEQALVCADPASLREVYVHDHDPIEVWHRDRVLLVGDAAHAPLPTSGQGACQAIEDAFVLAWLLDDGTDPTPSELFPRWTRYRRDKAHAIMSAGRGFARMVFQEDARSVAMRNEQSRRTDFSQMASGMARLWSQGPSPAPRTVQSR